MFKFWMPRPRRFDVLPTIRQCVARASHLIRICALPACACVLPARVCAIEHRGTGDEADMLYKIQKNLKTILVNLEI